MMIMHKSNIAKQCGVSLIEILVAVFVVSIGLLGVARMEILAKQSNADAIERTTATQLAKDMIEKMRANPKQLASYVGKTLGNSSASFTKNCDSVSCSATDLASWDLYQWEQELMGASDKSAGGNNTGGLDTPRGCITSTAVGGAAGVYQISIAWKSIAALKDNSTSTCGAGLYGTSDANRRVLTLSLYISDDGI